MSKISEISSLLKKIHRVYTSDLVVILQDSGFTDIRASFIEILLYIAKNNTPSIKEVGDACGLKKQTMTSHLNELESRGYIKRVTGSQDKRELLITLTEYGEKFKMALLAEVSIIDEKYLSLLGEVEIDRLSLSLTSFFEKTQTESAQQSFI